MTLQLKSVFKSLLWDYRELLLATGVKPVSIDRQLKFLDDFFIEEDVTNIVFDNELITKWHSFKPEQGQLTKLIRINFSIRFLNYLRSLGYDVSIPRHPRNTSSRQQYYIYSNEEVSKYFKNIDSYYSIKDPMVALYLPVIFRILYSCGTRIGEVLNIKVKDVNLDEGIILLTETKNKKHRQIIISNELNYLLRQYANKCLYLKKQDDYFFSHIDRKRVSEQSIYNYHRKALTDSNIKYIGGGLGPRLHDWRHTFCVNSLLNFEKNGCDLYNVLPILKEYMGHSNISSTERYLKLVIGHFDEVIDKTDDTTLFITGDDYDK